MRISKMLEMMCNEFKAYHYEVVDGLESDEETAQEQVVFDKHQRKAMEFINCLRDLLAKPQPDVPSKVSTKNRLVDRRLDFLAELVLTINRAVQKLDCGRIGFD